MKAKKLVISDRYTDSRYAYQSVTLEKTFQDPLAWIKALHAGWTVTPDLTFLLVIPPEKAVERRRLAGKRDHFEQEGILRDVQAAYLGLALSEPSRFIILDGLLPQETLVEGVESRIRTLF